MYKNDKFITQIVKYRKELLLENTKTETLLDEVCKFYGLKNYTELADQLDVQLQTLTQWKKRNSLGTALQHIIEFIRSQKQKFSLDEFFFQQRFFDDDLISPNIKKIPDPILLQIFAKKRNEIFQLLAKAFLQELLKNQILQKEYEFEYQMIEKMEIQKDDVLKWAINSLKTKDTNSQIFEYLNDAAYLEDKTAWRERAIKYCGEMKKINHDDNSIPFIFNALQQSIDEIEIRQANIIIASVNFTTLFEELEGYCLMQ